MDGLSFTPEGYERAKNILKTKYGKPSEVANAHTQEIIALPTVYGSQPSKIQEFYGNLVTNIQALETMGKIKEINGYVWVTLDKLPGVRADLVRLDDEWQDWGFPQMIEALRKWCDRNPVRPEERKHNPLGGNRLPPKLPKGDKAYHTKKEDWKPRPCTYCESAEHKSINCEKVESVDERKKIVSAKKLYML